MPRAFPRAFPVLLTAALLAGCGGSGSSSPSATAVPRIAIAWPARTRAIDAPASAEVVKFTLTNGLGKGKDLVYSGNRPSGAGASEETYTAPQKVVPGKHKLTISFHLASSRMVASAILTVNVDANGNVTGSDGKPLADVTLTSDFKSVVVDNWQSIEVDESKDLTFQAVTVSDAYAALPYGAVRFRVVEGSDHLRVEENGSFTGVSEGQAKVIATVDGIDSEPTLVQVFGRPIAVRALTLRTEMLVANSANGHVLAALPTGSQVVSIDPATAAVEASITVGKRPTLLRSSEDGSTAYVFNYEDRTLQRIDLATNVTESPFRLQPNGVLDLSDLAFRPGSSSTFATSLGFYYPNIPQSGITVFDGRTPRPVSGNPAIGANLVWTAPDRIVVSGNNVFTQMAVDAQGVTRLRTVEVPGTNLEGMVVAGNRLYVNRGLVFDADTLTQVGRFTMPLRPDFVQTDFTGPVVDVANNRAYFVQNEYSAFRLLAFRLDTFELVSSRRLANDTLYDQFFAQSRGNLIRSGTNGLAFRTNASVVFIDQVPEG